MDITQVTLVSIIVILGIYGWFRQRHTHRVTPESGYVLNQDETGISLITPHGVKHGVAWQDLIRVCVRVTPKVPMMPNFYWILESSRPTKVIDSEQERTDVCALVYPSGASGEAEILAALIEHCQGFDQEQLVQSLKRVQQKSTADFVIWKK